MYSIFVFCFASYIDIICSQNPIDVTIDTSQISSWTISPHLESVGIEYINHQIYGNGLYSQMIFGESFEEVSGKHTPNINVPISQPEYISCGKGRTNNTYLVDNISEMWMAQINNSGNNNYNLLSQYNAYKLINNASTAFNGNQYQQINFDNNLATNGYKSVGITNYGLNCQLGLFFVANKDYNGFIYLRNPTNNTIDVELNILNDQTSIISQPITININAKSNWTKYHFSFNITNNMNSTCFQDNREYYQCNGHFVISLNKPGDIIHIDLVYLSAGIWGIRNSTKAGSLGLPANKALADMFQYEGLKVLRNGGSMCNQDTYRWKLFRGPRDQRQPYQGFWYRQSGLTQSRGFGMFEIIDLCNEIECQALITINNAETADDMADFVEYCYGDNTTDYGNLRIKDGHADIYNVSFIEIGNEQSLTEILLQQIINITNAMDKKLKEIDATLPAFRYCIGQNLNNNQVLNNPLVGEYISNLSYLGDRIYWDLHVGGDPNTVSEWKTMVVNFENLVKKYSESKMRFVILEENGGDHGLLRGLGHALYNSIFILYGNFGRVHGYANAIQAWQGMDKELAFSQGQLFYLPNMTWGQTTFYVEKMLSDAYLPYNINVTYPQTNNFDVVGASSANVVGNDMNINLYFVNWAQSDVNVNIKMKNTNNIIKNNQLTLNILEGVTGANDEENSPSEPKRIYPKQKQVNADQTFAVNKMSFVIASVTVNT